MAPRYDEQERARRSERRHRLSCAVSQFPHTAGFPAATDRAREAASQRAKNAVRALGFVIETLADASAPDREVQEAIRTANAAYRATNLGGERFETYAAMELVSAIRAATASVLDEGVRLEDVRCPRWFALGAFDFAKIDQEAFRGAVAAWVGSERAMRKRGRASGRTPAKWEPTLECLERFGLKNGIGDAKNLARMWRESRPQAPLTEFHDTY